MQKILWADVETFSSIDLRYSGAYKYFEAIDAEVLMLAHAMNDDDVTLTDLCSGEELPDWVVQAMEDPEVLICSRNALFERLAFDLLGFTIPPERFFCTAVLSGACGLPLSLEMSGKAVEIGEDGKDSKGAALIRYFSIPCKPTKTNGGRFRNLPHHNPEKWAEFIGYCIKDVYADRNICKKLIYEFTETERKMYALDQRINDRGIKIDLDFVNQAIKFDAIFKDEVISKMKAISGLDNPNSVAQLKAWLNEEMDENITSLNKTVMPDLIKEAGDGTIAAAMLELRVMASKTSVKKYAAMLKCICEDGRVRGLFQFYGAMRTGRWAGRLIQLQNLPQNHLESYDGELEAIRQLVEWDLYEVLTWHYEDIAYILSQLVRTALIAEDGHTFPVADFAAIEGRVIAWLAGEGWRIDVFNSHGMIYEASASMMFSVPLESIKFYDENGKEVRGVNYSMRAKGKVAELALGYQGGVGALKTMGGEKMGLSESEMKTIVTKWRKANPKIVSLWYEMDRCAQRCIKLKRRVVSKYHGIAFDYENDRMTIELPSGRKLSYYKPYIGTNRFGSDSIRYKGVDDKKNWSTLETYGGKLVENIVQAIARDLLVEALLKMDAAGLNIVMHVHDEAVVETKIENAENDLKTMLKIMSEPIEWAEGLPLSGSGYITPFYKKD